MRRVCVLGVGSTKYGKLKEPGRELALAAARDAVLDAGIQPKDIGAGFISNALAIAERQGHLGPLIMTGLGIPDAPATTMEAACSSGASAFREAYVNVAAGLYEVMLVVGMEKITQLDTITATTYFGYGSDLLFEAACGASFPGLYATMARAHMVKYGTTEEQMARVAVKNHYNGARNPKAHFQKEITVEDVLRSPVVASPLKLYDSCPFSDGASAVIVASEDFAKAKAKTPTPIYVLGSGRAGGTGALYQRQDLTSLSSTKLAVKQALNQASIPLEEVDFAEVHDCFTIAEIIATEDLGFFEPGKGAKAAEEGATSLEGEIPINPSGGLKAKGHPVGATGVGQIVELYDQLMGRGGRRQIAGAEVGLAHNVGATGGSCAVHILGRG